MSPSASGATPSSSGAPSKVTLSLGHLPEKKDIKAPWPRTPTRVDPNNPPWPAYRGYHEYSFAHATMQSRLPTILGKAVDDTIQTLNTESSEERILLGEIVRSSPQILEPRGFGLAGVLRTGHRFNRI